MIAYNLKVMCTGGATNASCGSQVRWQVQPDHCHKRDGLFHTSFTVHGSLIFSCVFLCFVMCGWEQIAFPNVEQFGRGSCEQQLDGAG